MSRIYLDDEYVVMTCNYFLQYTQLEIPEFRDTLMQHMESVKKSIDERALHKRDALALVNLVDIGSNGTESKEQDTSSRSGNDAHANDADIRPIYDEEPMAEVQTTAQINVFATGQQHTEQPEFNNEGEVDQNAEQLQIHQSSRGIFINQAKYTLEILKKHGMEKCDTVGTPMATKPKLDADLSGKLVDQTDYRSKIRSLMYLTSSRPDIVQADFGFELIAFSDADHAGCIDTRKSTSGGIQFLGDKLVSWVSKKQDYTEMSSAEAEYVVLSASCAQVMWMRTQLKDYVFNYNKIPLYCDSQSAIAISCNPVQHSHTKHIHTRYHFIKEQVENGSNTLSWKPCQGGSSKLNLPDHRYKRRCCSLIPVESDSLPHAHTQTTKTYYKHQDSRIKKAQELKTKTSAYSDIKDNSSETKLRGRLLKSSQEDAKYEHVGQDTRSQGGKNDQD
ncbi:retrovirus-related pol polyprotein from transposon TNT 1-94 [Tanacetum coccineum]